MSDDDSVLTSLVDRFNARTDRIADRIAKLEQVIHDFDVDNIPRRQRKNLPYILDWWGDREEHARDWRYYLPLILSFIGPIIGGIVVVLVTHGR